MVRDHPNKMTKSRKKSSREVKVEKLEQAGHLQKDKKRNHEDLTKEGLYIEEVISLLNGKSDTSISELNLEEKRYLLEVWREHNPDENPMEPANMTLTEIEAEIQDAQQIVINKFTMEDDSMEIDPIDREISEEAEQLMAIIKDMKVDGDTTDEQLATFTHEQRSHFLYWASLTNDTELTPVEEVLKLPQKEVLDQMKQWRNKQKPPDLDIIMEDSSIEGDIKEGISKSKEGASKNKPRHVIQSKEVTPIKVSARLEFQSSESRTNSTRMNEETVQDSSKDVAAPFTLDKNLTDAQIDFMSTQELRNMYHLYSAKQGSAIALQVLNVYSEDFITKTIKAQRKKILDGLRKKESSNKTSSLKNNAKYQKQPVQENLYKETVTYWRYTINFAMPEDQKGTEALRGYLSDLFHEMCSYCQGLSILPWNTTDASDAIDDCENIPTTITKTQKYFDGVRSPTSTGSYRQYSKIRLGIPVGRDRGTFEADIMGWCKARNIRMMECSVQHPHVRTCGWLAYLPSTIDRKKWCRVVQEMYARYSKSKNAAPIQVGLVWRALNGQRDIAIKDRLYAMHVDTPRNQHQIVRQFLRILAQNKQWPLGARFRVMNEFSQYMSDTMQNKYRYMFNKHKTCHSNLGRTTTESIINLDKRISDSKLTLRDIVNNIRDSCDNRRIFATIDAKWNSSVEYVAIFRPDKTTNAHAFTQSLATYVLSNTRYCVSPLFCSICIIFWCIYSILFCLIHHNIIYFHNIV